ncbi:MAG: hypothetical protein CMG49_02725, partial [Candidatus Marinimicrobia bacterium]|nr:hypothetical protein [Candidatus Neomarinimicrobiota bacterium]
TEYGSSSDCGVETSYNYTHNGCLSEISNDQNAYDFQFQKNGNRLNLISSREYNSHDYEYGYSYSECTKFEFQLSNLPNINGCTDQNSLLYNPFATSDNGTCDQGVCGGSYIGDYLNSHNENNGKNNKSFLYPMVRKKIKND